MSSATNLESFLSSVNPQFTKYATILQDQGLTDIENLSVMQDDDFKHLGIPLFHWRQILAKAKTVIGDTPEGTGKSDSTSQSQPQQQQQQSQPQSKVSNASLVSSPPKPKSEAAIWDAEIVALWVRTYDSGAYVDYSQAFKTQNIDGAKLLALEGVKELVSLVPDLGARYGIYQGIEQLRAGPVPSVSELLAKDKEVQQKLKIQKTGTNFTNPSMDDDDANTSNNNNNNNNGTDKNEWTQVNSGGPFNKNDKINLQAKSKDDSSVRQRLIKFYEIYNPQKLDNNDEIDELLRRYQGKETQLFADLEKKYILSGPKTNYVRKEIDTSFNDKTEVILRKLSSLYHENIRQVEEAFNFPEFHTPLLDEVDFLAKPMILLVGQYSVGKTSFIRYLLGRDFPGANIGPEPTTDGFSAIMYGREERIIPGHTVPMDRSKPFRTLQGFGAGFLNKFNCVEVPAPILESVTFIDTPGILSGEKQRLGRNYDFAKAIEWFSYRVDRILILFDAYKLDISDELKTSLDTLKGQDDKVRCVLNKADQINNQQLLRVYGALMWSLGKVFKTPEVLRVYVGSFWEEPYANDHNAELFDAESDDLLSDLRSLPRHCATRKINEFVKRTRQLKVHCLIIEHLRKQFGWFGKDKKQNQLLNNLRDEFKLIAKDQGLNLNDFPNPDKFKTLIEQFDISKFPKFKEKWMEGIDNVLENEIPNLMRTLPSNDNNDEKGGDQKVANPFANMSDAQNAKLDPTARWAVSQTDKAKYDTKFYQLELQSGKSSGNQVMSVMMQSGLTREVLKNIWDLSDIDQDGKMDHEEFALCMYLIDMVKGGIKLPPTLPIALIPPGKRGLVEYN